MQGEICAVPRDFILLLVQAHGAGWRLGGGALPGPSPLPNPPQFLMENPRFISPS